MKTLVTILTLLIPSMLMGQEINNHFADSTSLWHVAKTESASNEQHPFRSKIETKNYGFKGDTSIYGEQWLKMYATKDTAFKENLRPKGYIRSQSEVVLFRGLASTSEIDTLYDFSLTVGDSIQYYFPGPPSETRTAEVKQVDSVQINGSFHKRIKAGNMGKLLGTRLNPVWIKGIGSTHGPLFPREATAFRDGVPDAFRVTCTKVASGLYWEHPDFSQCRPNKYVYSGVEDQEEQHFTIQPNPFKAYIRVRMGEIRQATLSLYNGQGQRVLRKSINGQQAAINVNHLTPGIYFAKIRSKKGVQTVKLVKED